MDLLGNIEDQTMGIDEVLSAFDEISEAVHDQRPTLEIPTLDDAIRDLAQETVEAAKEGDVRGLPMHLKAMQETLGCWRLGRMHIISAVTSGHKSTLVRGALEHIAEQGYPSLLISYEDPNLDFAGRSLVSMEHSKFTTTQIMNADFGAPSERPERLGEFIRQVELKRKNKIPMYLWDRTMYADQLISFMHRATRQLGLKAIGIDFLQLIRSEDPRVNTVDHLDRLANRLQIAAKDLGVALIVAAQPTQAATHAATKNNVAIGISDIKGASAISQACFGMLALHFPMTRVETQDNVGGRKHTEVEYERVEGKIMIIPRKWKSGKLAGAMTFACDGAHDLISDIPQKKFYG